MSQPQRNGSLPSDKLIVGKLVDPAGTDNSETSTKIFERLEPFHDFLGGPVGDLYTLWSLHPSRDLGFQFEAPLGGGPEGNADSTASKSALLDQLCDFATGYFWAAGNRAKKLADAANELEITGKTAQKKISSAWEGTSSDYASRQFAELLDFAPKYRDTIAGFGKSLTDLGSVVREASLDIVKSTNQGSSAILKSKGYNEAYCGGQNKFLDSLNNAISWGRESGGAALLDRVLMLEGRYNPRSTSEVARGPVSGTGPIDPQHLRSMSVDLDTGYHSKWSDMFCTEMDNFAKGYSAVLTQYREQIRTSHQTVSAALRTFVNALNVPTDLFRALPVPKKREETNAGVGGRVTGNIPVVPPVPPMPPQSPVPVGGPPVVNPVTGLPMELDPRGQPYPIDPLTGAAIKDLPETLTVARGDGTLVMSEPDRNGEMDIKVADGSGNIKNYHLDFGPNEEVSSDTPSSNLAGADTHAPSQYAAGQLSAQLDGVPVQTSSLLGPAREPAHLPGADGAIHIEDGSLKITAERVPGIEGAAVVTIDDGQGAPTTYTLGAPDTSQPGSVDQSGNTSGLETSAVSNSLLHNGSQSSVLSSPVPGEGEEQTAHSVTSGLPQPRSAEFSEAASQLASSEDALSGQTIPSDATQTASATSLFDSLSYQAAPISEGILLGDTTSLDIDDPEDVNAQKAAHSLIPTPLGLGSAPVESAPPGDAPGGAGLGLPGGIASLGSDDQDREQHIYGAHETLFDVGSVGARITGSLGEVDPGEGPR